MHDIAEFLGAHDPFSGLADQTLEELAKHVEVEFFPAGERIPSGGAESRVRVVRRGSVELLDQDRVLDLIGEGELFGHPRMLAALTPGFELRAHEDSLCYAIDADEAAPALARRPLPPQLPPSDPTRRRAEALLRHAAILCDHELTVREAARRMDEEGVDAVLVRGADELGIVTDADLRSRVVAAGLAPEAPLGEVMSSPLVSVAPETTGAEVLLRMLEHDVHHLPVLGDHGEALGIISSDDLVSAERHTPFVLRREIASARSKEELRRAASRLGSAVRELHGTEASARQVSELISVVSDGLVKRMIELAIETEGEPPADFAWLSLGSHGRREPVPSSDLDSGMAWDDAGRGGDGDAIGRWMHAVAADVASCAEVIGWRLDAHGVTATGDFSASSIGEWREAIERWLSSLADDRALFALSVVLDGRVVHGDASRFDPKGLLLSAPKSPPLLGALLRSALVSKPPTGFLRDIVVEHSGEHRGTVDLKRGGVLPVVGLARYAAYAVGSAATSTPERLTAGRDGGSLDLEQADSLAHAHELFARLRLDHQVRRLERGEDPDDHLDPAELDALERRYLRDAFREVAAIQRSLNSRLDLGRGRI